jgi:hypothetical protein
MLNNYLDKLDITFKNTILDIINNNINIKKFLANCAKLNIYIFEKNTVINRVILIEKIENLKEVFVKTFGMKIFKKYSKEDCNCIENIEKNFSKLKQKINIIKELLEFLSKYSDNEFKDIFKRNNFSLKINYSIKPSQLEILEFDENLFITSDEIDLDSDNLNTSIIYPIHNKDKYIDEYSN